MAFWGTQQKCKACCKTVYVMEELTADGVVYHKSCFRCNHCKGTLKLSNYSSLEGVLYCKPHLKQLVKETGSFNKILQPSEKSRQVLTRSSGTAENTTFELKRSASKVEKLTPQLTRVPSKAAMMFSGTQEKCITCGKTAYPLEKEHRRKDGNAPAEYVFAHA